jgi:HD superfamily phosphohydrolase
VTAKNQGLRIQDSIYGIVDLNKYERRVVDSHSFQRLLSVKQLGFAYAVFPGADYSRFSHCVGACHVMTRLLESLNTYGSHKVEETDKIIYRLAALLHDVGHYPFSHATEHAIERRYKSDVTKPDAAIPFLNHEQVGAALLERDSNLKEAIAAAGFEPSAVSRIFRSKDPGRLTGLIASDVDADRLDYLPRTAYHTGLPYGHIDQDYLVREVRIDNQGRLCWSQRALPALDHILLGRSYDYQQVAHNKTVVALELLLGDIVYALTDPNLGKSALNLSEEGVNRMIESGDWYAFDDHMLFEKIRTAEGIVAEKNIFAAKCAALINREPPRRVAEAAVLTSAKFELEFDRVLKDIKQNGLNELALRHKIDRSLWWVWGQKRPFVAFKGDGVPTEEDEETGKLVRVLLEDGNSILAVRDPQSTIGQLCTTWRFVIRIYVLISSDDKKRSAIGADAQAMLARQWSDALERLDGAQLQL